MHQILLSAIVRFLISFVHWMVFAHLPAIFKDYGMDDVAVGVLIGLYSLSSMALMLPMGIFSDIFSPKRTIVIGAGFFVLYLASLLAVRSFSLFLPVVLVGGFGSASLMVVTESLYLKQFGSEKRGARVAAFQLCGYLGYGLGPLFGGILLQAGSGLFFNAALAGGLLIVLLSFFLRDSAPIVFSFKEYGGDILRPKPLLLVACVFVAGTHFGVEQTSITLLMKEALALSPREIGYVFAGIGLWMALSVPFIGRLHDRRQNEFLFLFVGLAISGLLQAATAWAVGLWSLLAIRLTHTLGDAMAFLELSVLVALFFPGSRLGGNSGLLYGVRTMATFLSALLAGVMNREWGYGATFAANGLFVCLFALSGFLFIMSDRKRMESVGWKKREKR